ncbi:DNA repair protein RadC [Lactobacillus sp. UCMA15818]|uniref:JAB domain-containing protein n=1 Tax=Lactobacillus sp. UCMA15818 TaxID=2583394 RepID=UPI0025B20BBD|nr:DNA repair protein RadC [Lactobacillus sp. UCMA15818]MDN2453042.1 DNA repair protein RadC [Lactobacillus sp. UCMA15818]
MLTSRYDEEEIIQRLTKYKGASLSQKELLFILICGFLGKEKAGKKVNQFFLQYTDLRQIKDLSDIELTEFVGSKYGVQMCRALCEFAERLNKRPKLTLGKIYTSQEIGEEMSLELGLSLQEVLFVILLDTKNQIVAKKIVFQGTLDTATVHPREIFRFALQYAAARIMIVHNHPSGDTVPSKNDLQLTKRIAECGDIIGIGLLDHIIVGSSQYMSMREEKILS